MRFEWDKEKAKRKLEKQGVSFHEAVTVLGNPLAVTFNDPDHSIGEYRYLTFGLSRVDRLLDVSHTEERGYMRIINARVMTKREQRIYEEG